MKFLVSVVLSSIAWALFITGAHLLGASEWTAWRFAACCVFGVLFTVASFKAGEL